MSFDAGAVRQAAELLRTQVRLLDADALRGSDAAELLRLFSSIKASAAAGEALAALRVETSNVFVDSGHADAASFVAKASGMSVTDARNAIATARRLEDLPTVDREFRSGSLSPAQATEVARAAVRDPRLEGSLVATAKQHSLRKLSDEARKVEVAARRAEEQRQGHERARRARCLVVRRRDEYSVQLFGILPNEDWAEVAAVIAQQRKAVFVKARAEQRHESSAAYDADALVGVARAAAGGDAKALRPRVNVVVSHEALVRGHVSEGETCEVPGVGPLPVAVVSEMTRDCILNVLLTKGRYVASIATDSRYVPSAVRAVLDIETRMCSVRDCEQTVGLELDHRQEMRDDGRTEVANLAWLCRHHHKLKTTKAFDVAGETGDYSLQKHKPPGDEGGSGIQASLLHPVSD